MTAPSVEMIKIKESGNVDAVGYDPTTRALHVLFLSGLKYIYTPVPKELVPGIYVAHSAGKYLHEFIIPRYAAKVVKPVKETK